MSHPTERTIQLVFKGLQSWFEEPDHQEVIIGTTIIWFIIATILAIWKIIDIISWIITFLDQLWI